MSHPMIKKRFATYLIFSALITPGPVMSEPINEQYEQKNQTESSRERNVESSGFYTSLGLSIGLTSNISLESTNDSAPWISDESYQINKTIGPNIAIGYIFPGAWRLEGEYLGLYSTATNKFKILGRKTWNDGDQVATNLVQLNVIKDIKTNSKFTPYIGGGLGIAFSQYNVMNGVHKGSASGTTLAGQGKAAISYQLSKDTSFYLGYRIVWINGGNTIDVWSDNPKTGDHLQQSVDAGIRIRL